MSANPIKLVKEIETPATKEFREPTGKVAYGFKYNRLTGSLDVIRHDDGSYVKMTDSINNIMNDEDYTEIVWSDKLLNFEWSFSNNYPGHLQVEIV